MRLGAELTLIVNRTEVYPQSFWLQINVLLLVLTWLLAVMPQHKPDQHGHLTPQGSQPLAALHVRGPAPPCSSLPRTFAGRSVPGCGERLSGKQLSITPLLLPGLLLLPPSPASPTASYVTPKWTIAALEQRANCGTKGLCRPCHWRAGSKGHTPLRVSPRCLSPRCSTFLWRLQPAHLCPATPCPHRQLCSESLASTPPGGVSRWLRVHLWGLLGSTLPAKP